MTDHADTIRDELETRLNRQGLTIIELQRDVANLRAERQQAIDEADALRAKADCGGVNCGKCQQCLTVQFGFAEIANKELRQQRQQAIDAQMRSQTRLLTVERRCEQAIDALREIAHGSPFSQGSIADVFRQIARAALVSLGEKPQ